MQRLHTSACIRTQIYDIVSGRLMAKFLLFKEGEEEKGRSFAVSSILNKTNFMGKEQNKTIDKEQTNKEKEDICSLEERA